MYSNFKSEGKTRPWVNDSDYKKLNPTQQVFVDAVLSSTYAIYQGGRQSGKTTMKMFIQKWITILEQDDNGINKKD